MLNTKLTRSFATVVMLLFTGAVHAVGQDVAINGDFETGDFSGWTQFPGSLGAAGQTIITDNPSSGTYAANLNEPNPSANIIKQANLLPGEWTEGQLIEVQFDIRGTAATGGVLFAEVFSELSGGGVSKSEILGGGPLFPDANSEVWTTYTFSTAVGPDSSGGVTLQFNSACGADAGCIADYFIDNVSIRTGTGDPTFEFNAGLNDAWFDPATTGQGFFITVFPVIEYVAVSWFTYDTVRPDEDVTANLGEPGHRWFNALGQYSGNVAVMDITIASGGLFDTPTAISEVNDGTIILTFTDCESGTVEYDIPSIDQQGVVPIQRVSTDNVVLCETLIEE